MTSVDDHREKEGTCWLACFDLLGFTDRVSDFAEHHYASGVDGLSILAGEYHERVLKALDAEVAYQRQHERTLHYAHFSDTFILYTPDDSRDSFMTLDSALGKLFIDMVLAEIPARGALTCGRFYADRDRNIFIGPALAKAYEYAEKQDWIGYVLTRQASDRLSEFKPPIVLPSITYPEWQVPVKVKRTTIPCGRTVISRGHERLFAFRIGQYPMIRESIRSMKKAARIQSRANYAYCRSKYRNTLLFTKHTKLTCKHA